jgi:phosphomannomutase
MNDDLLARAKAWTSNDPDEAARAELTGVIEAATEGDAKAEADLADRFAGVLEFGTAGLRGVLGAGPNRMNRAVVLRATHGLATHLATTADAKMRGVVIGYDGRRMSRELAEDTACVLVAHGFRAMLFDEVCQTPITAFAVSHLGAAAGVMVTASHNPPEYNGYKVYWGNGAQIIPPIDADIARAIESGPPANQVPRESVDAARASGALTTVAPEVERAYLDAIAALGLRAGGQRDLPIVYTPLHGVGHKLARMALTEAHFSRMFTVAEQAEPDGEFPTVAFPNPEEKGAMDLSFALAAKEHAALVLANDPDADRLAVAVPSRSGAGYVQLTGNQVGVLLGHYVITRGPQEANRAVLASIVSSPMLGVIARKLGVHYEETLTGFKWIANRAIALKAERGLRFVFGYEEALGYTVGEVVRDKDGVSAALLFAEFVAGLASEGKSVLDELEQIHRDFGLFVSSQVNVTKKGADGAAEIRALMDRLRALHVDAIGPLRVVAKSDFSSRVRTSNDGSQSDIALPKTNMVAFELEGASRIIARPSGTEPKVKFYFDVRTEIAEGEAFALAEARANAEMAALRDAFVALAG